jgi:hypothetical protein
VSGISAEELLSDVLHGELGELNDADDNAYVLKLRCAGGEYAGNPTIAFAFISMDCGKLIGLATGEPTKNTGTGVVTSIGHGLQPKIEDTELGATSDTGDVGGATVSVGGKRDRTSSRETDGKKGPMLASFS